METVSFEPIQDQSSNFALIGESKIFMQSKNEAKIGEMEGGENKENDSSLVVDASNLLEDLTIVDSEAPLTLKGGSTELKGTKEAKDSKSTESQEEDDSGSEGSSEEEDDEDEEDYDFAAASEDENEQNEPLQPEVTQKEEKSTNFEEINKLKQSMQIKDEQLILQIIIQKINEVQARFEYANLSKTFILHFLKKFKFDVVRACEDMQGPVMKLLAMNESGEGKKGDGCPFCTLGTFKYQLNQELDKQLLEGLSFTPLECPRCLTVLEDPHKMEKTKEIFFKKPK